eukprot:scaffold113971_cov46-Prasinocladus_malaysianus.AAC.1
MVILRDAGDINQTFPSSARNKTKEAAVPRLHDNLPGFLASQDHRPLHSPMTARQTGRESSTPRTAREVQLSLGHQMEAGDGR